MALDRDVNDSVKPAFKRGFRPPLEIVKGGQAPTVPASIPSRRGVEEVAVVPPGFRRFLTVSSTGELLEDVLVSARIATPRYIAQRHRLLALADPQAELQVI